MSGIYNAKAEDHIDFKAWISRGEYKFVASNQKCLELFVTNRELLVDSYMFDCARMACAAMESVECVSEIGGFPKSTAWAAIKMYYAAFFSAHAIMRIFGRACSHLEDGNIKLLREYSDVYGINVPFCGSGYYRSKYDQAKNLLCLEQLGETHKDTWKSFRDTIKGLSSDVLLVAGQKTKKQQLSATLDQLVYQLENRGSRQAGNWLSVYRNNLNYRQDYGAWYPYKKDSIHYHDIEKYIYNIEKADQDIDIWLLESDERKRFFGLCASVIYICRILVEDICIVGEKNTIHKIMAQAFIRLSRQRKLQRQSDRCQA
jgi:hypothetical protein